MCYLKENCKRVIAIITLVAVLLFFGPQSALAAWAGEENFDSYTNGSNLDGLTGGSGWSGVGWVGADGTAFLIDNSQSVNTPNSTSMTSGSSADNRHYRALSVGITTDATVYVSVRTSDVTNNSGPYVGLIQGAPFTDYACYVQFGHNSGQVSYFNGTSWVNIKAISNNTWYRVGMETDTVNQLNKCLYTIDNGNSTGWVTSYAAFAAVSGIILENAEGAAASSPSVWFDAISATYATTPAAATKASDDDWWWMFF